MSRFTDEWVEGLIEEQNINKQVILDWLKKYTFVNVDIEYEFVTLNIKDVSYHLDFGICANSIICCTYGMCDYKTEQKFSDLQSIKDYIYGLSSFQYNLREKKLGRILNPR